MVVTGRIVELLEGARRRSSRAERCVLVGEAPDGADPRCAATVATNVRSPVRRSPVKPNSPSEAGGLAEPAIRHIEWDWERTAPRATRVTGRFSVDSSILVCNDGCSRLSVAPMRAARSDPRGGGRQHSVGRIRRERSAPTTRIEVYLMVYRPALIPQLAAPTFIVCARGERPVGLSPVNPTNPAIPQTGELARRTPSDQ